MTALTDGVGMAEKRHRDWALGDLFGPDTLTGNALSAAVSSLARQAFGHDADPARTTVEPVAYDHGAPATGALLRVRGRSPEGQPWALFCKVIQHPRHWRRLGEIPDFVQVEFLEMFPWRQELGLWDEPFLATMPDGLRAPNRHALIDLGDDCLALWLEHVTESAEPWDMSRYASTARSLGRWNMRATAPEVVASCPEPPLFALGKYADSAVRFRGLGPLADDELWSHPWLADHADLRAALRRLGDEVPSLLSRAAELTLCRPHGDASPQNLLIPADDPGTVVAIDVSFQSPTPLGTDLSQLAVGLVHADVVPAGDLPDIAEAIVTAYVEGLREEGWAGDPAEIELGFCISVLVRSGFDGFRYELLAADPADAEARACFDQRVVLARFVADLAQRVLAR